MPERCNEDHVDMTSMFRGSGTPVGRRVASAFGSGAGDVDGVCGEVGCVDGVGHFPMHRPIGVIVLLTFLLLWLAPSAHAQSPGVDVVEDRFIDKLTEGTTRWIHVYDLRLRTRPTHDVIVTATASAPDWFELSDAFYGDYSGSASLTFTPENWNVLQEVWVFVNGADDNVDNPPRLYGIGHSAASKDADYDNIPVSELKVIYKDDEFTTVTLSSDDTTAEEESATETARLTLTLSRPLRVNVIDPTDSSPNVVDPPDEYIEVPLLFKGGILNEDFRLELESRAAGISLRDNRVTFTGSAAGSPTVAHVKVIGRRDGDSISESVTVTIPQYGMPPNSGRNDFFMRDAVYEGRVSGSGEVTLSLTDTGGSPDSLTLSAPSPRVIREGASLDCAHTSSSDGCAGWAAEMTLTGTRVEDGLVRLFVGLADKATPGVDYKVQMPDANGYWRDMAIQDSTVRPGGKDAVGILRANQQKIRVVALTDNAAEQTEIVRLWLDRYELTRAGTTTRLALSGTSRVLISPVPVASFASPATSAAESSGTQEVVVKMSWPPTRDVRVNYKLSGTATRGADYTISGVASASGRVTVAAGTTSAVIPVAIIDDGADDEGDETVVMTMAASYGGTYVLGLARNHTLTIAEDDGLETEPEPVTPAVSVTAGGGGTEGGDAVFTVTADPAPTEPLAVSVTVSTDGDFGIAGGSQTVTVSTTGVATLTLPTTDDDVDEPDGSVTLTVTPGDGYTVGVSPSLTLAVEDDDEPAPVSATAGLTVSLAAERNSIAEAKGETKFTIALSRALGAGETAVVPFTVTGGKPRAHWNIRFRGADNGPGVRRTAVGVHSAVTFTEGGRTATLVLIAQPNDDRRKRTIGIAFGTGERAPSASGVEGGITPVGKAIAVAIVDDDKPRGLTVSLAAEHSSIAEAKGETRFTIALSRALGAGETATVPFTVTGGPRAHWNIRFRGADNGPGVRRTAVGAHSAVTFTEGGQTATLVLMAKPNDDRKARTIGIAFGTGERAPSASGVKGGITPVGKAIAVAIVDDDKPVAPEGRQAPAPVPVLALAGPGAVTEGGRAGFTLTADPSPASDLAVTLRIAQTGAVAPPTALGERTVTMAANTATLAVPVSTAGDATDEPDGALTVTVVAVGGVPVEGGASATVAVTDDDATAVVLSAPTGDIDEAGGRKTLTVTLGRALVAGEALAVPLTLGGAATLGGDYTLTAPSPTPQGVSHAHLAGTDPASIPTLTFTGPSATSATLALTANADTTGEGAGERVTVALGTLAAPGLGGGARGSGSATFSIVEPPPEVSIAAKAASITEGAAAAFTVSASRAPGTDLAVTLAVSEAAGADFVAAGDEGAARVTIAKGETEAVFTVPTVNDTTDEPDGTVTVMVAAHGEGDARYRVAAAPNQSASVAVSDDDVPVPVLSVADATVREGEGLMWFTVRLSAPSERAVKVSYRTRESTPVSAQANVDYLANSWTLDFRAGETEKRVWVYIYDDNHDEGPETFEVVLRSASGAPIGDGVGVGTIVNDDPMPAAWLGRFGRTVAEQALDGIAGRMAAPRTPGMQGTLAGQALTFGAPADGAPGPWSGAGPGGAAVPGGTGALALAEVARGFAGHPGRFGADGFGHDTAGVGGTQAQSHTMTARDALLGSHFTLTGETDGSGGSMAFWGRGSQARFDGREGDTFSLDGEAATAMLGADYARGEWLIGLALVQSTGEGGYSDIGTGGSGACSGGMDAQTRAPCEGAVRAGDGEVEASLSAAIPYASLQASERLKLWGAAGYGSGEVTLETAMDGSYRADTTWRMAAAGLRGALLAPPESGSGPALAVTSDALWARTSSEKTRDLASSESDATRLRLGLEGSYRFAMEGGDPGTGSGASLVPRLEVGARHDGGDAETGFGIELGGGIAWSDPRLGLSLDLSGRTLLSHEDDALEDRGYAASLGFDPDAASERGPSFALRQEFGSRADGGLDALFQPATLEDRTGGEATSRWSMEAAYGFPAFGGRFTGSPHVGLGLATGARDYTLGWRLAPEAANAPDLSFGLQAVRRESDTAEPEHRVGFEINARW